MDDVPTNRRWALALGALTLLAASGVGLGALGLWLVTEQRPSATITAVSDGVAYQGASTDGYTVWDRNDDGQPVRWDPCRPVEFVIAPDGWPVGTRTDLELSMDRLAAASGLELSIVGETDERPSGTRLPYQPERYGERWAPVLVAWSRPGESGLGLRDVDRGLAAPVAVGADGDRSLVSGQVVFNAERDDLEPGAADRATSWRSTMLHELAHLLGLGHVQDEDELMSTFPGEGPVELGPGDRRGLAAVGAELGCRPPPPAQPVEVSPGG